MKQKYWKEVNHQFMLIILISLQRKMNKKNIVKINNLYIKKYFHLHNRIKSLF